MVAQNMSSTTSTPSKRVLKRKLLDDSILKKARVAMGLPQESPDDRNEASEVPSLKLRKPRHNTPEGQAYVKNKEKRKKEEDRIAPSELTKIPSDKEKKNKKRKQRKKKKSKVEATPENGSGLEAKNPESEKKHAMEALSYLQLWSSNREHWKFEKLKQTWLLKNSLNTDLVDEPRFELLLEYIGSVKGAARKLTLTEMQTIVTKYEMCGGGSDDSKKKTDCVTEEMYDRARQIIQVISDE